MQNIINDMLEHMVVIEINGRRATMYTASLGSAQVAATAAMGGGASRVWIDGRLVGGPVDEIDVDNQ
jgi:hypothetical protein